MKAEETPNPIPKLSVTFIGLQETKDPERKLALVNEPDGSTVIFNPDRHEIKRFRIRGRKLPLKTLT
ncbi:MAG TPA: hypothetical protein VLS90_07775 [Thermodesulfobacteriota bacterium]|nr:hypothetical protein [Thermodesulfobacteriota bacterium]